MAERKGIPMAPIIRIVKAHPDIKRISKDGKEAFVKYSEKFIELLIAKAIKVMKEDKRVTLKKEDVEKAYNILVRGE